MEEIEKAAALGTMWQPGSALNRGALTLAGLIPGHESTCAVLRGATRGADGVASGLVAPADHWNPLNRPSEPGAVDFTDGGRVPTADAIALLAASELGRRGGQASPTRGARISSAGDVAAQAAAGELVGLQRERVVVIVCDAADRLRATVTVSEGALDRALFPVREILHAVLIRDGRSFAVAHNHPSGDPEPSAADVQATRAIRDAARVVGLRFLGHVVVVEDGWQEVR